MSFNIVRCIAKELSRLSMYELSGCGGEREIGMGDIDVGIDSRGVEKGDLVIDEGVGVKRLGALGDRDMQESIGAASAHSSE